MGNIELERIIVRLLIDLNDTVVNIAGIKAFLNDVLYDYSLKGPILDATRGVSPQAALDHLVSEGWHQETVDSWGVVIVSPFSNPRIRQNEWVGVGVGFLKQSRHCLWAYPNSGMLLQDLAPLIKASDKSGFTIKHHDEI